MLATLLVAAISGAPRELPWEHSGLEVSGALRAPIVARMKDITEVGCKRDKAGSMVCGTGKAAFTLSASTEATLVDELVDQLGDFSLDRLWLSKSGKRLWAAPSGRMAVL